MTVIAVWVRPNERGGKEGADGGSWWAKRITQTRPPGTTKKTR